ncbi:DUF6934 family protein [Dyadobacter luticola]|uniref:Uncharacterized protein n=1 Tax=Dyadobacter luticola TaxID=1979387 RepID=A0A5R9L4W7_9BACT|nr:hypothetical protein [Dyadobacter luticola]TLV03320.1 hypothetical protein FEN17_06830 [Dyadobacter luticola]
MDQAFYAFVILEDAHRFNFVSVGKQLINKTVIFQRIGQTQFYNLALADIKDDGTLDVLTVSNNGDTKKIFATVFQCITNFLQFRPESTIVFMGSTKERTNIYHWLICRNLEKARLNFLLYGYTDGYFETFNPEACYESFAISLKNY